MDIYKIIAVAVITAALCVYLKSINSDFYILTLIAGGTIILLFSLSYLSETFSILDTLATYSGAERGFFVLLVKITVIGYLVEFACSLIEDFGIKSLSDKLAFAGKILLLCMSIPILKALTEMIIGFIGNI